MSDQQRPRSPTLQEAMENQRRKMPLRNRIAEICSKHGKNLSTEARVRLAREIISTVEKYHERKNQNDKRRGTRIWDRERNR